MRVFNLTKRHLTGADLRRVRRLFRKRFRSHSASLVKHYGEEAGRAKATAIHRRQQRELVQVDGAERSAYAVWARENDGALYVDGGVWTLAHKGWGGFPVVRV